MYQTFFKNLLAVTIILTLILSGCGKTTEIKDKEDLPEAAPSNSDSNEATETEDNDNTDNSDDSDGSFLNNLFGKDDINELKEVKWDKNIPNVFPEIKDGKCVLCKRIEVDESVWTLYYVDISEKDIEDYSNLLKKNGWEQVSSMEMGDISTYTYMKDEYAITATVAKDEDNGLIYGLFLEDRVDKKNIDDREEIEEDYQEEANDDTIVYDEQELPDDFPKGEIPMFEDGILTVASRILSEGQLMFMLDYMSEKDFNDISDDLIKAFNDQFASKLNVVEMGEMTMITGESENYGFSVILVKTDQEDYPTNVSYTVISNEP